MSANSDLASLGMAIACDGMPANLLSKSYVKAFLQGVLPNVRIPTPNHLHQKVIPGLYSSLLALIKRETTDSNIAVCVMTDGWTPRYRVGHYNGTCISYIATVNNKWVNRVIAIGADQIIGPSSNNAVADASAIATSITKALATFGIETRQVTCVVRDGGQPYPCVFEKLKIPGMHCMLHVLNLVFEQAARHLSVKQLFDSLHQLTCCIHKSQKLRALLLKLQQKYAYEPTTDQLREKATTVANLCVPATEAVISSLTTSTLFSSSSHSSSSTSSSSHSRVLRSTRINHDNYLSFISAVNIENEDNTPTEDQNGLVEEEIQVILQSSDSSRVPVNDSRHSQDASAEEIKMTAAAFADYLQDIKFTRSRLRDSLAIVME